MQLQGRTALVTGAWRGIGKACAEALAKAGAEVMATDIHDTTPGYDNPGIAYRRLDVSAQAEWDRFEDGMRAEGRLFNILVAAAGVARTKGAPHDVTMPDWDEIIAVNQTGILLAMRAVTRLALGRAPLSIVNISSIWGQVGGSGQIAYHASKGAVINMTRNTAVTYAQQNIRANAICPGLIDTEMVRVQPAAMNAATLALTPMGRIGQPEEIAQAAVFLASDAASFITGAILPVDGGFTAQ